MDIINNPTGRIHSVQSLGTLDGPGVRYVVFMQGCPLRCACCHNPDTHALSGGEEISAAETVQKAARFKSYFGERGGITISGGEPLLQAKFVRAVFELCRKHGINTCLDTSGCILNGQVKEALELCDRVLLDIKYPDEEGYEKYVGCHLSQPLKFLDHLDAVGIPTTLRQVVIPGINDTEHSTEHLKALALSHKCVDGIELLPFRKICTVKYDGMGISFPFRDVPEADAARVRLAEEALNADVRSALQKS